MDSSERNDDIVCLYACLSSVRVYLLRSINVDSTYSYLNLSSRIRSTPTPIHLSTFKTLYQKCSTTTKSWSATACENHDKIF